MRSRIQRELLVISLDNVVFTTCVNKCTLCVVCGRLTRRSVETAVTRLRSAGARYEASCVFVFLFARLQSCTHFSSLSMVRNQHCSRLINHSLFYYIATLHFQTRFTGNRLIYVTDHPHSVMVYNFGRFCPLASTAIIHLGMSRQQDAEGVEGVRNREGVSPPQSTKGLGSIVGSPAGSGADPRPKLHFAQSECKRSQLVAHIVLNFLPYSDSKIMQLCVLRGIKTYSAYST